MVVHTASRTNNFHILILNIVDNMHLPADHGALYTYDNDGLSFHYTMFGGN
jgi:hypothetical protein